MTFVPIGIVRSPFADKASAPRQAPVAREVRATIELHSGRGFEDALSDLERWDHLWVLFHFHLVTGWRPKVLPPRSDGGRKGVFATRSPHRPNPIGLTAVRLERIEGLVLHVRGVDIVDQTPVLDLKPYVAYADAIPEASGGWLSEADPKPIWEVRFSEEATEELAFLASRGTDIRAPIAELLALGPEPHAYRRIRTDARGAVLAHKEWRVRFVVQDRVIVVVAIQSGYRPRELAENPALELHRELTERFERRR